MKVLTKEYMEKEIQDLDSNNTRSAQPFLDEGNRQFKFGEYGISLDLYRTALEIEPNNEIIAYNLGYLCYLLSDLPESLNYFNLAVDLKPDFTMAIAARDKIQQKIEKLKKYTMGMYQ
jgi:tetratricopeptide (TPR) repeat protein